MAASDVDVILQTWGDPTHGGGGLLKCSRSGICEKKTGRRRESYVRWSVDDKKGIEAYVESCLMDTTGCLKAMYVPQQS